MKKTIKLASVLLRCGLGTGTADDHKKSTNHIISSPILLLCLLPVMYYLYRGGMILAELFGSLDQEGLMLGFFLFLISTFIFCAGIAACINSFYLSSNLNTLLVMPFTPGQITGAKFIAASVYEYGISLTVLAPVLIGYGQAMQAPASFWVGTVLAVLLLPVVPMAYAAILSMVAMRFIGGAKNKERMTAIGAVGAFVFLMIYQIIAQATKGMKAVTLEETIVHLAKMLREMTWVFPDLHFFVKLMNQGDWLSVLWSLCAVVIILAVLLTVSKYLYLAGAVGLQDTAASHKKLTEKQMKKVTRHRNVVWSYTWKELRTILRTPAYYTSCLFLTLGWPLVLILPVLFSKSEQKEAMDLRNLLTHTNSSVVYIFILFCIVYAVTVFVVTLNGIASSSISREGRSFPFMKQIPLTYRKQLRAKQNAALIVCFLGSGMYMILGELVLTQMGVLTWWSFFPTILFYIPLLYIIVDLKMIYGLMKPSLSWESEGDVASGNRVGIVMFLLGIVIGCVVIFGFSGWVKALECGPWVFTAVLGGSLMAAAFFINRIFYLYGEKRLEQL